ncbi:hypothetical protein COO91_09716 (plasmid) [Nostoc flagelliforme CCNUN1]|uniref:Uncharacterized protein n=1 Tax=Nostoc flagelliforme CCNUN1 TaxID=2038116 RepID=A0A2K8T8Z0_9NOSO|nr:hypothetical protein [Nostoc flagelliforme]AUB43535.1 hypothetical protein COO91_09716 [Nostoc flagelliforme CCNUN1]
MYTYLDFLGQAVVQWRSLCSPCAKSSGASTAVISDVAEVECHLA